MTAIAQSEPQVGAVVSAAAQPGTSSAADKLELMALPCRHEVPNNSGRRCALCGACLHRDIAVEEARATCQDCGKSFVGW